MRSPTRGIRHSIAQDQNLGKGIRGYQNPFSTLMFYKLVAYLEDRSIRTSAPCVGYIDTVDSTDPILRPCLETFRQVLRRLGQYRVPFWTWTNEKRISSSLFFGLGYFTTLSYTRGKVIVNIFAPWDSPSLLSSKIFSRRRFLPPVSLPLLLPPYVMSRLLRHRGLRQILGLAFLIF